MKTTNILLYRQETRISLTFANDYLKYYNKCY